MKLVNAINKLKKYADNGRVFGTGRRYWAEISNNGKTQIVGFLSQEDYIICIYSKTKGMESDSMTDYFVETWHSNLSRAISFACGYVGKEYK